MKQKARDWAKSRFAVAKLKGFGASLTTGLDERLSNENGPIFVIQETIKGLKNFKISMKIQKNTFGI